MIINWSKDLGNPTKPGQYEIKKYGKTIEITITQKNIDAASREENPDVRIDDATSQRDNQKKYKIGQFIPKQKEDTVLNFIKNSKKYRSEH
ncbi:MAG: hypothetical protein ACMUJM_08980 [bacterium]